MRCENCGHKIEMYQVHYCSNCDKEGCNMCFSTSINRIALCEECENEN